MAPALNRWALAGIVVGAFLLGRGSRAGEAQASPYAALDTFARVLTQVQQSYVEAVSQETLIHGALAGLAGALDPHSAYYAPQEWRRVTEESAGHYVGIGTETRIEACGLRVTDVLRGGPADRAGLLPGDCIVAAGGSPLADLAPDAADALVRGAEGDTVTLVIDRGGTQWTVVLLRARVLEASVESDLLRPGIVLLRIRQFHERTAIDLDAEVARYGVIRGAILDLRDNPGGRLDEAAAVVDRFVGAGTIVTTRGRGPGATEAHVATAAPTDWTWPVVVLINERTASAAEIVAGALKDLGRAAIVGTRSYGKGSVQTVYAYEDGSAFKLTIGRYYLPLGEAIRDREGVVPDVDVPLADDPAATLRSLVADVPGLRPADRLALSREVERVAGPGPLPPPRSGPIATRLKQDPALAKALSRLPP